MVIAANGRTQTRTCKGAVVSVNGDGEAIFLKKSDVLKTVERTAKGSLVNKRFGDLNLGAMEKTLETNPWIRDAELYLDTKDVLHVSVWERQPIARVFATSGASFYIDSACYQLPLLENYSVRLPVVTGFSTAKKGNVKDSLMLQGLKEVINTVVTDSFWNAQVGQIDITPDRKFELVPVIGSHVIKLGYGENVKQKLNNLLVFYKQVLPKAGFAKYAALDVQFDGQVVAVRKGPTSVVDSLQLQKNIEELMKKKEAEQEPDDALPAIPWKREEPLTTANDSLAGPPLETTARDKENNPTTPAKTTIQKSTPATAHPSKSQIQNPKPATAGTQKPPIKPIKKEAPKPKAVMPSAQPKSNNEY